jgi:heterodisulfide reductase subunit A-like polyferredoxin
MINFKKSVEIIARPDVLVCGIGCAGIAAAIGAARMGAKTMAVEKWPFAGGNITAANVNGCCGLADMSTGELIVAGVVL